MDGKCTSAQPEAATATTPPPGLKLLSGGIPTDPLPNAQTRDPCLPHAPVLLLQLTRDESELAVSNALRYFPARHHALLAPEFRAELLSYGHIYMYRLMPCKQLLPMQAYPISWYDTRIPEAAGIMAMIMNNLDPRVAQFPQELVTYGTNGQVLSNWAQFWLLMRYLSIMDRDQTINLYSGHAAGLFPSSPLAPRVIITNGMMVPNYSQSSAYNKLFALGVTMYGQMTAGSYCYIGPQGIVHGTVLTLLNAGRKYLGTSDLSGKVFLSSGLGGMSGAQAKAAVICGCIGIIADVDGKVIAKRKEQKWVDVVLDDTAVLIKQVMSYKQERRAISIAFHGNIVDLWQAFVDHFRETGVNLVDLASDQTSCHNVSNGGYYPHSLTFDQGSELLRTNASKFRMLVKESLRLQVTLINELTGQGSKFWDYGNAFLLEASRAGADVGAKQTPSGSMTFRYPSYVQDIMGDIFSLGFGPFRWVCMSQSACDLKQTDAIALKVMSMILDNDADGQVPDNVRAQYRDNMHWISECTSRHNLVVGSQARILYSDQAGRVLIALAFNRAIREGHLSAPVVLSRDHHDVSGTDSPFRETSNITDGSSVTADMAVQNFAGLTCRGATWVAVHNGGGVGWGEVMNGGFGLLLDGSSETDARIRSLLNFDVSNGVARRAWARNENARATIARAMRTDPKLIVTMPYQE